MYPELYSEHYNQKQSLKQISPDPRRRDSEYVVSSSVLSVYVSA